MLMYPCPKCKGEPPTEKRRDLNVSTLSKRIKYKRILQPCSACSGKGEVDWIDNIMIRARLHNVELFIQNSAHAKDQSTITQFSSNP